MKIKDIILLEAKPSGLGQGMLDKLFATYSKRDINDTSLSQKFEDGMQIAEYLFDIVGAKNLMWVCKQYNQDEYFFLHDIDEWKKTFDDFNELCKDRRIQIEKDINKYKSITDLRNIIEELSGRQVELGSKFFSKVVNGLEPYFNSGDAELLYRGNDYIIYHPISFESSSVLDKGNLIGSVNLCTVMSKGYFDQYNSLGYLIYIISQKRMYNCYINTASNKHSEFADQQNDHSTDLPFLLEEFPRLKDIIINVVNGETDIEVLSTVLTPSEIKDMIQDNGRLLSAIPPEQRDLDICLTALSVTPDEYVLTNIPPKLWQKPELYKIIMDNNLLSWSTISYAPEAMQIQQIQKKPIEYSSIENPSELVTDAFIRNVSDKNDDYGSLETLLSSIKKFTAHNAYTFVSHHGWLAALSRRPDLVTPKIEIAAIDFNYRKDLTRIAYSAPKRLMDMTKDVKSPQAQRHLAVRQADLILTYLRHGGDPAKLGGISNDMFNSVFSDFVTELHINARDQSRRSYISSSLDKFINLFIGYLTKPQLDTLKKLASERKLVLDAMPNMREAIAPSDSVDPELANMLSQLRNNRKSDEVARVKELSERLNR